MLDLHTAAGEESLTSRQIHTRVASTLKIRSIPATLHNSGRMDNCQLCHGGIEAISILDQLDVKEAYTYVASRYHSVHCHVGSDGSRTVIFGQEKNSMLGRLVIQCEVSSMEAAQILR